MNKILLVIALSVPLIADDRCVPEKKLLKAADAVIDQSVIVIDTLEKENELLKAAIVELTAEIRLLEKLLGSSEDKPKKETPKSKA